MTFIDVGRLLGDIIDDAARIGGGVLEIGNAILDDPRIAVLAAPAVASSRFNHATGSMTYEPGEHEQPVCVDRNGVITCGNLRWDIATDDPTPVIAALIAARDYARTIIPVVKR